MENVWSQPISPAILWWPETAFHKHSLTSETPHQYMLNDNRCWLSWGDIHRVFPTLRLEMWDASSLWIIREWNYFVTPQSSHVGSHRVAISRGQICIFHRTDFVTFNPKIDNQFNLAFGEWIIFPFWWAISFTFRHNLTESKFCSPQHSACLHCVLFTFEKEKVETEKVRGSV